MLKAENLRKLYNQKVCALQDINLELPKTGLVFVLGKSGSGKSTLLNILAGLDNPTKGQIYFDNVRINSKNVDDYRRKYVSFIYQDFQLLNSLSVADNIALAKELIGERPTSDEIIEVLNQVELDGFASRLPTQLSGEQMQRVAIARAIIKPEATIFADEPTGNLDSETGENIFQLLKKISENRLVVIVSHDKESAKKFGDYCIEFSDGKIISNDIPTQENNDIKVPISTIKKNISFKYLLKLSQYAFKKKRFKQFLYLTLISITIAVSTFSFSSATFDANEVFIKNADNSINNLAYYEGNPAVSDLSDEFFKMATEKYETPFFPMTDHSPSMDMSRKYDTANRAWKLGNYSRIAYTMFIDDYDALELELIAGEKAVKIGEVVIPQILADNIVANGYLQAGSYTDIFMDYNPEGNNTVSVKSYGELMGKTLYCSGGRPVTISGIFRDTNFFADTKIAPMDKRHTSDLQSQSILDKTVLAASASEEYMLKREDPRITNDYFITTFAFNRNTPNFNKIARNILSDITYGDEVHTVALVTDVSRPYLSSIFSLVNERESGLPLSMFIGSTAFLILLSCLLYGISFDEKTKEVGILKGLGAKNPTIYLIFFSQMLMTSLIQMFCGGLIGGLCVLFNNLATISGGSPYFTWSNSYSVVNFFVMLGTVLLSMVIVLSLQGRRILQKTATQIMRNQPLK